MFTGLCKHKKTPGKLPLTSTCRKIWAKHEFYLQQTTWTLQALWGKKSFQCMQGPDVIQGASPKSGIQIIGSLGGTGNSRWGRSKKNETQKNDRKKNYMDCSFFLYQNLFIFVLRSSKNLLDVYDFFDKEPTSILQILECLY